MGINAFELTPEQRQYFTDVDNSILHHSVELGKLLLQEESLKSALSSLYASRIKSMNAAIEAVGLDPQAVLGARIEGESLVVQLRDVPPT